MAKITHACMHARTGAVAATGVGERMGERTAGRPVRSGAGWIDLARYSYLWMCIYPWRVATWSTPDSGPI